MRSPTGVPSPCIGVCRIGPGGLCEGCFRSRGEIAAWPAMDAQAQRALIADLERRRNLPARLRA